MSKLIASLLMIVLVCGLGVGLTGCSGKKTSSSGSTQTGTTGSSTTVTPATSAKAP